jgi:hypothetical protein
MRDRGDVAMLAARGIGAGPTGPAPTGRAPAASTLVREELRLGRHRYLELKDPCPVYDGTSWHLFGTGVTAPDSFEVFHAVADRLTGPWEFQPPVPVPFAGSCVAAPGAVADKGRLHLFLQTEYNVLGGRVEHLVSADGGSSFEPSGTVLTSAPEVGEPGVYDPHPALLGQRPHLVYSAFSVVGEPDVHLAVADGWDGPWERLGPVLRHEEVEFHNQRSHDDYEWGLEGAQLLQLPGGRVLLNGVCFLTGELRGTRQRVFFATADDPLGPYAVSDPVLDPLEPGENGHSTAVLDGEDLVLFFQERSLRDPLWRIGLARAPLSSWT